MTEMDSADGALLEQMQAAFPLTSCPFGDLGRGVGLAEEEVLSRARRLKEAGIIRQIGAIFDTRRLGYQGTLAAFHVEDEALEDVAVQIGAHPGVSHNYARSHYYNLWFTLAVPPGRNVEDELRRLARQIGVDAWLNLPALRVFKIRTHFRLGDDRAVRASNSQGEVELQSRDAVLEDVPYVRALQQDLPLVPRPFAEIGRRWGLSEEDLLAKARELEAAGIMRRFGAVLRHRRVGYTANGMACWVVPRSRIEEVGRLAARLPQVSHCYQRPAYPPHWPYTMFTMIHGQTKDDVETVVAQIANEAGIAGYEVLYSTQEFKKERIRYFEEEM